MPADHTPSNNPAGVVDGHDSSVELSANETPDPFPRTVTQLNRRVVPEALQDIANINVFALPSHRFDDLGQELAGFANEGEALEVFFVAGGFSHEHQVGSRVALSEDDVRSVLRELAAGAPGEELLERRQVRDRPGHQRGGTGRRVEVQVGDAEVAEEFEVDFQRVARGHRVDSSASVPGQPPRIPAPGRDGYRVRVGTARAARNASQIFSATSLFERRETISLAPSRRRIRTSFSGASKPISPRPTSLTTTMSAPLASIFRRPRASRSSVSAAKARTV